MSELSWKDVQDLAAAEETPEQKPLNQMSWQEVQTLAEPQQEPVVREAGSGLGEAFIRGAGRELMPYWQEAEEHRKKRTGTETLVEMVGNIGAGITAGLSAAAVGAKIGAAVGSAVPGPGTVLGMSAGAVGAFVATGLYAIYSGIGEEHLRSRIEGKDFSNARALAQVGLAINPILKNPGKIAKTLGKTGTKVLTGARVAGQGVTAGTLEYDYTDDLLSAAIAGVLTTGVTAAFRGGMRANTARPPVQVTKEALDAVATPGKSLQFTEKFRKNLAQVPKKEWKLPDEKNLNTGFKTWLLNTSAMEADPKIVHSRFADVWGKVGKVDPKVAEEAMQKAATKEAGELVVKKLQEKARQEAQENLWKTYKTYEVQMDTARQLQVDNARALGDGKELAEQVNAFSKWYKDAYFIAEGYDQRMGTNLQGAIDEVSKAEAMFSNVANVYYTKFRAAQKATKKLGLDNKTVTKYLELKDPSKVPTKYQKAIGQWRDVYNELHTDIGGNGFNIGYLQGYAGKKSTLKGADLAYAVHRKVDELAEDAIASKKRWVDLDETDEEMNFLKDLAVRYLDVEPDELRFSHLRQLPKAITTAAVRESDVAVPTSLFTRRGGIPEFARERDAGRLAVQYLNSNLRSVYMDQGLKQIRAYQKQAEILGQNHTSDWLKAYITQQTGGKQGAAAVFQVINQGMRLAGKRWQESDSYFTRTGGKATEMAGDWLAWTNSLVYPAFLGANLQASLRNMTQPLMVTAPTLGGAFGYKTVTGGAIDTLNLIRQGKLFQEIKDLRARGIIGQTTRHDVMVQPDDLAHGARRYVDRINDGLMAAYSWTDELNRVVTFKSAQRWVKSLAEGDEAAVKALKELSAGRKTQLRVESPDLLNPAVLQKSEEAREELTTALADWMITRTQFQYGPTQQAHFARMGGPLFSMFTKWPSMIGSDITHTLANKPLKESATKLMQRYGYGYMVLMAVDSALQDTGRAQPGWDYAVGKPTRLSPVESAYTWSTQGPAIQFLEETVGSIGKVASGKEPARRAVARSAVTAAKSYFPVASSVLNEADRWVTRAKGRTPPSKEIEKALERKIYQGAKKVGLD